MEMHTALRQVLEDIFFLQRYKSIVVNNTDFEHRFSDFKNSDVLELINSFGYQASYNKKEDFFKILEAISPFQFQFNISLGGGVLGLIWDVKKDGERLSLGSSGWSPIANQLGTGERLKNPVFTSFENLQTILKEAFNIYEDFKKEVIKRLI